MVVAGVPFWRPMTLDHIRMKNRRPYLHSRSIFEVLSPWGQQTSKNQPLSFRCGFHLSRTASHTQPFLRMCDLKTDASKVSGEQGLSPTEHRYVAGHDVN